MLLVIDVGNTNITLGVYKEEKLEAKFRMTTKLPRTSDEYGISLCDLIEHQGFEIRQIDAVIIASVVPDIMHSLTSAIIKYLDVYPLVVSSCLLYTSRAGDGEKKKVTFGRRKFPERKS